MHQSLIDLGLTPEHEANLRKLAMGLIARCFPGQFHMGGFMVENDPAFSIEDNIDYADNDQSEPSCDTAGCALGWAAWIVEPRLPDEDYWNFGARVFGLSLSHSVEALRRAYNWCFSSAWSRADNTADGAGRRILWMLDNGVPENADRQQRGYDALSYR